MEKAGRQDRLLFVAKCEHSALYLLLRRCLRWSIGRGRSLLLGLALLLLPLLLLIGRPDILSFVGDLDLRSETLVVRVLHDFADMNIAHREMQLVIRFGVRRKPVLAIDLFAVGHERG